MKKLLLVIFWALIGNFAFILCQFFVPAVTDLFSGSIFFLLPFIIFSLLGGVLIFLTLKEKVEGLLKKFLFLTGLSAAGFFVGVFLHNAFYALGTVTNQIVILGHLAEILDVAFFLIAVLACPLGFLTGAVGSIILLIKKRRAP